MILVVGVVLAACCSTPTGAEVAKHTQLFIQSAAEGRKDDAQDEKKKLVKAFQDSLDANSIDSASFIDASCPALLKEHDDLLKKSNDNLAAFKAATGATINSARDGQKVCPLADEQRQTDVGILLTEITIVRKDCGDEQSVQQMRAAIANPPGLRGLSAFYCRSGYLYAMPEDQDAPHQQ
jgi:hypothetical protein